MASGENSLQKKYLHTPLHEFFHVFIVFHFPCAQILSTEDGFRFRSKYGKIRCGKCLLVALLLTVPLFDRHFCGRAYLQSSWQRFGSNNVFFFLPISKRKDHKHLTGYLFFVCFLSFTAMFGREKSQVQTGGVVEHPRLRWCAAEFAHVISRVPSGTCGCGDLCDHRVRFTQDLSES